MFFPDATCVYTHSTALLPHPKIVVDYRIFHKHNLPITIAGVPWDSQFPPRELAMLHQWTVEVATSAHERSMNPEIRLVFLSSRLRVQDVLMKQRPEHASDFEMTPTTTTKAPLMPVWFWTTMYAQKRVTEHRCSWHLQRKNERPFASPFSHVMVARGHPAAFTPAVDMSTCVHPQGILHGMGRESHGPQTNCKHVIVCVCVSLSQVQCVCGLDEREPTGCTRNMEVCTTKSHKHFH